MKGTEIVVAGKIPKPSADGRHPGVLGRVVSFLRRAEPAAVPLSEFFDAWMAQSSPCKDHVTAMRRTLVVFGEFVGHEPTTSDLNVETFNRWLDQMFADGLAQWTVRGRRTKLLTLWNVACKLLPPTSVAQPVGVRTVRRRPPISAPWSAAEINSLLSQCDRCSGKFPTSGVVRRWFWRALILTARDTSFLPNDLFRIAFEHINPIGVLSLPRGQSCKLLVRRLQPETMTAIAMTMPPKRLLLFGGVLSIDTMRSRFVEMTTAAGLEGPFKRLRMTWLRGTPPNWHPGGAARPAFGDLDPEEFWAAFLQGAVSQPTNQHHEPTPCT